MHSSEKITSLYVLNNKLCTFYVAKHITGSAVPNIDLLYSINCRHIDSEFSESIYVCMCINKLHVTSEIIHKINSARVNKKQTNKQKRKNKTHPEKHRKFTWTLTHPPSSPPTHPTPNQIHYFFPAKFSAYMLNKLTCRPKKRSADKFDSSDPSYCQFLIKL